MKDDVIQRMQHWVDKFDALPIMTTEAQQMRQDALDCIAALSPVLPEEIRAQVQCNIDMAATCGEPINTALRLSAEYIERLAQEKTTRDEGYKALCEEGLQMQQRIEELTENNQALCDEILERDAKITHFDAALAEIKKAMLPDPHDERDISLEWLRKTIHKIIDKARAGE